MTVTTDRSEAAEPARTETPPEPPSGAPLPDGACAGAAIQVLVRRLRDTLEVDAQAPLPPRLADLMARLRAAETETSTGTSALADPEGVTSD